MCRLSTTQDLKQGSGIKELPLNVLNQRAVARWTFGPSCKSVWELEKHVQAWKFQSDADMFSFSYIRVGRGLDGEGGKKGHWELTVTRGCRYRLWCSLWWKDTVWTQSHYFTKTKKERLELCFTLWSISHNPKNTRAHSCGLLWSLSVFTHSLHQVIEKPAAAHRFTNMSTFVCVYSL